MSISGDQIFVLYYRGSYLEFEAIRDTKKDEAGVLQIRWERMVYIKNLSLPGLVYKKVDDPYSEEIINTIKDALTVHKLVGAYGDNKPYTFMVNFEF